MPKLLVHNAEARNALARGVQSLAAAVEPTLGPKGLNAMIDRPVGTPLISRDGVSIASEIELFDRFENMGAQVVREVSMQTNDVAGDGTTTSIVLANGLIQAGVPLIEKGVKAVDLCKGISLAIEYTVKTLRATAMSVADDHDLLDSVARIAASDAELGALVTEAFGCVGPEGIITTDYGITTQSTLEVVEGMSFDRGYISHHMVTDQEKMRAVIENPYIILTDIKTTSPEQLVTAKRIADEDNRPLVIISEETSPEVLVTLLGNDGPGKYLVVHPPEFGQWRKAMMEDLAILTGGQVLARDLGHRLEDITREQLGQAERVEATASDTSIIRGAGDPQLVAARRAQVQRQYDVAPPNIEQDKLQERLAKLCGGTAIILAGGVTPVEQKRTIQLIEDSLNAVRAAFEDGVLCGGGVALTRAAPSLDSLCEEVEGDVRQGVLLVQSVLTTPLMRIAFNAGAEVNEVVGKVGDLKGNVGFNASTGAYEDLVAAGIVDPARVTCSALMNAASVATLILTTETLIGDLAEDEDPTAGPALGGGAEKLGRQ
ncbi:molecular chaperone GroEL [Hoeflea sp. TYP-13]|uniref:molecular chaperone GroEL n=1 Tax=Hoeflea sp. TYP-13 TaxID=3230023 RepID=UPI0034C67BE1